jgi:uncharacterized RDD family membrane protein YckC
LSTQPNTATLFPEWKQEVNRRVAAHLNRRTPSRDETGAPAGSQPAPTSRAARAAARVAARYANAPSYNDVLTREAARAAVQAAEAASKAAQEAQAAFQYVLDDLEAATSAEPAWGPEAMPGRNAESHASPVAFTAAQMPAQRQAHTPAMAKTAVEEHVSAPSWELDGDTRRDEEALYGVMSEYESPAITEAHAVDLEESGNAAKPIYANLIEFPREMVAARRARPRRAEGPLAAEESAPQLSIFEVDPAAISILPPPATAEPAAAPAWTRPEWTGITLDALPASMSADVAVQEEAVEELLVEEPAIERATAPEIELAPLSRRLLATVVDFTLIAGAVIGAAMAAALHVSELPGVRTLEIGAGFAVLAAGVAWYACLLTLFRSTPGMAYAGVEFNTFSGLRVTRARRWGRMMALLLSVLPLGLGFAWALFDKGGLTWHDRLSRTYLRKR